MQKEIKYLVFVIFFFSVNTLSAQETVDSSLLTIDRIFNSSEFDQEYPQDIQWIDNGDAYVTIEKSTSIKGADELIRYDSETQKRTIFVSAEALLINENSLNIESFTLSPDGTKVLIFNNSMRVWRTNTKGDYWVIDLKTKDLKQLGKELPASSLMFAKFSSNNKNVAYVSKFNLYLENYETGDITKLTKDGTRNIINGTFDWVYEEEFLCKDGFRWSPDGKQIAFWQLDASKIRDFLMINNTDSIYSRVIPVQYPKVGEDPSSCKVGSINTVTGKITWMNVPGDPKQHYIPRMQWVGKQLLVQQLNRKQNQLMIYICNPSNGESKLSYTERDDAWVDILNKDVTSEGTMSDMKIMENGKSFLRITEKDGWRHAYKVRLDGSGEENLTNFDADIARFYSLDNEKKNIYINASPENSTQRYLYKIATTGKGKLQKLTPEKYSGVNQYNISPNGKYAIHTHTSTLSPVTARFITLPEHEIINTLITNENFKKNISNLKLPEVSLFEVTTESGVKMDGVMTKPVNFDANKKYPVLFYVYGGPAGQDGLDSWISLYSLSIWNILLAQKGYVIITMDNRGTPCLKGREWRKSIYRKIGILNVRDQALAAKEVLKWSFIDKERTAVWGWSSGGSMTLNLMFQYPEIYKTGMAIAAVTNQLAYDNIYQERYMGLPQENMEDFVKGSPLTYAKNLQGNLLIVHGTADDNDHYQHMEMLINELIKENKQFQMMSYPNRSHGIYEGKNTTRHLYTLLTNYLIQNNPPN
ncbi:DPP IV N-terminal domain-containing protein [Bacteroidota bacterium]